jgi:hypothetical protein
MRGRRFKVHPGRPTAVVGATTVTDMISKSFLFSLALLAAVAAAGSASVPTSYPAAAGIGTSPGGR